MNQVERGLVETLSEKLASKFDRIEIHRKPSASSKVEKYLYNQLGYLPILQPEIDMILWGESIGSMAVELKAFNPSVSNKMHSFYEGIGQALALHRYGFDYSALWFLFQDADMDDANRYGAEAWSFVRNDLRLPLGFTYLRVKTVDGAPRFYVMQYTGRQEGYQLLEIDDPNFMIRPKYPNPIRNLHTQKVIREALERWFSGEL